MKASLGAPHARVFLYHTGHYDMDVTGPAGQQSLGSLSSSLLTAFIHGAGDLNSDLCAWAIGALHTELHLPGLIPTTF